MLRGTLQMLTQGEKLLNKLILYFVHKKNSRSFAKLKLSPWCNMDCFIDVRTTFLGLGTRPVFSNAIYHDNKYARYCFHGHFKILRLIIYYKLFRILRIHFISTWCMLHQRHKCTRCIRARMSEHVWDALDKVLSLSDSRWRWAAEMQSCCTTFCFWNVFKLFK